ncbi:BgTH12-04260 [Blumeria graminis f. sp. triticale]|nr:BgTH12-04260 [Blumeria graminis f. sp. triticale]
MSQFGAYYLTGFMLVTAAFSQQCRLQFDARVPQGTSVGSFDVKTSLFRTTDVIGKGSLKFSEVIELPKSGASLFDEKTIPFEVTISDKSIFNDQVGFRRAEVQPVSVTGTDTDPSSLGIKTLHFSLKSDPLKALNTSHEYQLVFMEDSDFSTNQFVLKTGSILGQKQDPNDLVLMGNVDDGEILFTTPFTAGVFHNFALKLNFDDNQISVFYSTGDEALKSVLTDTANDLTGHGMFHFGLLKKPVGEATDIAKGGFQPDGIDEGIIYGGIFQEDSVDGCLSSTV